jgi:type IV secretion system protein VirD4
MSNVRSRAIHISFFFQALGQLQNRYPDNMWSEVLGSADTTLVMGCNDPISAEYVSERSGEVTIYADTVMKQQNIFMPSMLQPNYRHSEGAGRRKLLTPDEVLRMEPKNMLIMLRGQQILEIEKFDYTRNPESKKFKPVSIRGLKDVPQYPVTPIGVHAPMKRQAPHSPAESPGKEVAPNVAGNNVPGPDADYAGPTIRKIGNPNI